jgi:hypothetical protein
MVVEKWKIWNTKPTLMFGSWENWVTFFLISSIFNPSSKLSKNFKTFHMGWHLRKFGCWGIWINGKVVSPKFEPQSFHTDDHS